MFRVHALGGVSAVAMGLALAALPEVAAAQSGATLPPVTVEAPQSQPRVVRRHGPRTAAAPSRQLPRQAPPERIFVSVAPAPETSASLGPPAAVTRFQLPQQSFSIGAKQIDETINLKDPEDAVKYMPSLFVRKRNDGDNQAVLATRSWGLNSSARTTIC
jgi:iron complex outermembrane receptor protein